MTKAVDYCLLGVLALLWGSSYLFIAVALTGFPPITLIALRVTIAAIFLLILITAARLPLPKDREDWKKIGNQAALTSIGAWTLLAWGQQHVDSGLASVLNSTSPIFVLILTMAAMPKGSIARIKQLGVAIGMIGVILIVGIEALGGIGDSLLGQLAALAGAALYGAAAIYGRTLQHINPMVAATGTMLISAAVLIPAALLFERPFNLTPDRQAIGALFALSILCTGLALTLFFRLVRTLGSLTTASQAYLRAGVGVVLGMVVLGESLSISVGLGLILTIFGVILITSPQTTRS